MRTIIERSIADFRELIASSDRHILWTITIFALSVIAMVWLGAFAVSRQDRATALDGWARETTNLVRALDEHTTRTMDYINDIAMQVKAQYERQGLNFDMVTFFENATISPGLFINAVVSDVTGQTVLSSTRNFTPANLSDREHVSVHVERDSGRLFISKPVKARVSKRWSIIATRRVNRPDGSYGGVAGIGIDPFYFTNFYKEVNLGKNSAVALVGMDGVVRARLSDTGSEVGQDIGNDEFLTRARAAPSGIYSAVASIDGVRRLNNYRVLRDYPLVVNVGVAENVIYADSDRRSRYYYLGAAFMTLVVVLMVLRLLAASAHAARASAAIASMNASLAKQANELSVANQELESFSYSVAHDLRAPLRAINSYMALVQSQNEGKLDKSSAHNLQRARGAGERMGKLIDDLLGLARLSRQEMRREEFNLSDLAGGVAAALAEAHPGRNVQITIQADMRADGDRDLMLVVVENLIGNAWKFTARTDSARIEIGTRQRDGQTEYYVSDNGAGFDMKYARNLFGPFQRLHRVDEFEGSGIGLATVHKIIRRHRGQIRIESAVNVGTTVFFSLPASPSYPDTLDEKVRPQPHARPTAGSPP